MGCFALHTTWLIAKLDRIKYIFGKPSLSKRIARWQVLLSEYDIQYMSRKAIKGSVIVDFLVDRAVEDYEPVKFDLSNEDLVAITQIENESKKKELLEIILDGASNDLRHSISAVLITPDGEYFPFTARLDFNCTNTW